MDDRVLLADFLDTAIMVYPDTLLHIFRYNGTTWKYFKTARPTLKESFLKSSLKDLKEESGYFKVEVRSRSSNRPIFPNTLYIVVDKEGVQRFDTKPLQDQKQQGQQDTTKQEQETQDITEMYDINNIIKAALEPLTQILNAQLQQTNQILSLLVRREREDEDPFKELLKELLRLRIEKEKLKLLRELDGLDERDEEDVQAIDGEEQALANQIIEAFRAGNIGTAFALWTQLKERNEQLAYSLLYYAADEIAKGNIAFPLHKQEVNNVQEQKNNS